MPTVDWLFYVAPLLFVNQRGRIMTHPTGSYDDWIHNRSTQAWVQVSLGENIKDNIYEFWPDDANIGPTPLKFCHKTYSPHTAKKFRKRFKTLRKQIIKREHGRCAITSIVARACRVSHFIPKRLSEHVGLINEIILAYSEDPNDPETLFEDVFDDRNGFLVNTVVGTYIDGFLVGILTHPIVSPLNLHYLSKIGGIQRQGPPYMLQSFVFPNILECNEKRQQANSPFRIQLPTTPRRSNPVSCSHPLALHSMCH